MSNFLGSLQLEAIAISADGNSLLVGNNRVSLLSLDTLGEMADLPDGVDAVSAVAISADRNLVAYGGAFNTNSPYSSYLFRVWDIAAENLAIPDGEDFFAEISAIAFSPDGAYVAAASLDNMIFVWDLTARRLLWSKQAHEGGVNALVFAENGGMALISGGGDGVIRFWRAADGEPLDVLAVYEGAVTTLELSPDGSRLVSAGLLEGNNTALVWDMVARQPLARASGHRDVISSAAFLPDGQGLVTGSEDGTIRFWDLALGD